MKKKNLFCLGLSIISVLSSCSNVDLSSSDDISNNNSSSTSEVEFSGSSVYSYLEYLKSNNNYLMDVTCSNEVYHHYVTPNYFYKEFIDQYPYGYISCNEGIYKIEYYDNKLVSHELSKDSNGNNLTNIYSNNLITTFSSIDLSKISDTTSSSITLDNKLNKLSIFNIADISVSYFMNLDKITISILEDKSLSIDVTFIDEIDNVTSSVTSYPSYNIHIFDIGVAHYLPIEDYISSGNSYYKVNSKLAVFKEYMLSNNYTRIYYDSDYSETEIAGSEIFNNRYYYVDYSDGYLKYNTSIYEIGNIGLKDYVYNNVNYTGTYYFTLSQLPILTQSALNTSYDIPDVMNYPSKLKILSNLQFLESSNDNYYTCYESEMISDFITNFNLTDSLASINASVYCFEISLDLKDDESESQIVFTLRYRVGSKSYSEDYIYTKFYNTYISKVDTWIKNNNPF